MSKIDLHIHTTLSDGDYSIDEIVELSKKNSCNKIAITDHEVIVDYSQISKEREIDIINGIEFNTAEKGMHILGYGIKDIKKVQIEMENLHRANEHVSLKLIRRLQSLNYDISEEQIFEFFKAKNIYLKYLDKRNIVTYLISKGYTKDVYDTYKNLIGRGTDLYIPLKKISPHEILELINSCGGIAILAHPDTLGLSDDDLDSKVKELINHGLSGIEVINGLANNKKIEYYKELTNRYNLLRTVGSDFHSIDNNNIGIEVKEEMFEKIKCKIR